MADSERCIGYHGGCDGGLEGMKHAAHCPMSGNQFATHFDAFEAGMRAGEIARWIPVEEKLPERHCYYLVYRRPPAQAPRVDMCWHNPTSPSDVNFWKDEITHWQPLPAAPEEKKPALSGAEESKKEKA